MILHNLIGWVLAKRFYLKKKRSTSRTLRRFASGSILVRSHCSADYALMFNICHKRAKSIYKAKSIEITKTLNMIKNGYLT